MLLLIVALWAINVHDWHQLWTISSAPDNIPIVAMLFLVWAGSGRLAIDRSLRVRLGVEERRDARLDVGEDELALLALVGRGGDGGEEDERGDGCAERSDDTRELGHSGGSWGGSG